MDDQNSIDTYISEELTDSLKSETNSVSSETDRIKNYMFGADRRRIVIFRTNCLHNVIDKINGQNKADGKTSNSSN